MKRNFIANKKTQKKILKILHKFYYQKINEKIDWYYRFEYLIKDLEIIKNDEEALMNCLKIMESGNLVILRHFDMNGYIGWGAKISENGLKYIEKNNVISVKEEKLFNRDLLRNIIAGLIYTSLFGILGFFINYMLRLLK